MRRRPNGRMTRLCLVLCALCVAATAQGLTIKLGSLAPTGSPWELGLKRLAAEWDRLSGGTVTVRVYAGGVAGDEPDMIRKMRIGTLNAALMTVSGIQQIFNGVKTLSYPLLLRDDGELSYVLGHMEPYFDTELTRRGFKPMMWSLGGWVYFFSRYPIATPDDLRRQRLWVWSGNPDEIHAYQGAGFQTVTIASTDLMTSLQAGMVDALVASPLVAAANQWFGVASNMSMLKLGPLWGATVVSTRTWNEIPAGLQPRLLEAAQKIADSLAPDLARQDDEAISVMKKYGLKIEEVTPAAQTDWTQVLARTFPALVGPYYEKDSFDMASRLVADYRAAHPQR